MEARHCVTLIVSRSVAKPPLSSSNVDITKMRMIFIDCYIDEDRHLTKTLLSMLLTERILNRLGDYKYLEDNRCADGSSKNHSIGCAQTQSVLELTCAKEVEHLQTKRPNLCYRQNCFCSEILLGQLAVVAFRNTVNNYIPHWYAAARLPS